MSKKFRIGLLGKLIIGIVLGIMLGLWAPTQFNRVVVTASTLFSAFLKFVIPLLIVAFVTIGIADLSEGAGKLLLISTCISYLSSLLWGIIAFTVSGTVFPRFVPEVAVAGISNPDSGMLKPFFTIPLPPVMDVTSALVLAFILGLCLSSMRKETVSLYGPLKDFSHVINSVLKRAVIPFLPLYICGIFVNMTVSGQTFMILGILWKVFLTVIILHVICLLTMYFIAGGISHKSPFRLLKNQVPGYISAMGTQSSAATIPVNLRCAEADGVSPEIRNFVIPLCANIHMAGSMITITCCVTAVQLLYNMPSNLGMMAPFIMTLGIAMVASPGAPGGSIMTALPFLPIVGIASDSAIAGLLIALYITQDSFGTACNVSGDNSISVIVDTIYRKFLKNDIRTEAV
ncbi:MAG: dicarboxylate/amino acid:cation symporter [Spirochaetaceae bacterium]|nr:dicarboxylate/amino acid:cation symporter [Spirochaetaceae bacterium]